MIHRKLDATSGGGWPKGRPWGATEVDQELQLSYFCHWEEPASPECQAVSYPSGSMPSHKPKTCILTLHYISPFLH